MNEVYYDSVWNSVCSRLRSKGSVKVCELSKFYGKKNRRKVEKELRDGAYRFAPPRVATIPKDGGGTREILILSDYDRIVMSFLATLYYQRYEQCFSDRCFSYRSGVSVGYTVREVQKHLAGKKCIKIDLSKYFDSVPRDVILEVLDILSFSDGITRVLKEFYSDDRVVVNGEIAERYKSLCQGCAFSSILANLVLTDVDEVMKDCCDYYARYSDDILIIDDNPECALDILVGRLQALGLSINPKKLKYCGDTVEFLGARVGVDGIGLSENRRKKIKSKIKGIAKKYGCEGDRKAQKRVVTAINHYLLEGTDGYSVLRNVCSIVTDDSDIVWLNGVCRQEIRRAYSGIYNSVTNRNKTPESILHGLGWCDLQYFWRLYQLDRKAFLTACSYFTQAMPKYEAENVTFNEAMELLGADRMTFYFRANKFCADGKWFCPGEKVVFDKEAAESLSIRYWQGSSVFAYEQCISGMAKATQAERDYRELAMRVLFSGESKCAFVSVGDTSIPAVALR